MKRRTKLILWLSIGTPVLLIGGLLLAVRLSSPDPTLALSSIEIKELPEVWAEDPVPSDVIDSPESTQPIAEVVAQPTIEAFGLPISGTLVMMGDDRPFGEESFTLSLEGEDVMLRSNGKFWFKALIATITITYDQVLQMDSHLRPGMLSSSFDAPLGFDRDMQAEFGNGQAIVRSGDDVTEFAVSLDRTFVLGTFSTYVIVPLLYELRQSEGVVSFDVLVFGGPPNRDEEAVDAGLPGMRVQKIEAGAIRFDDQELIVSRYVVSGDMGTMMLYARGVELLGLLAGDDEESMFVYRADYFESGFEVVDGDRPLF